MRQRSFLRGSPSGPVFAGPLGLAPANFFGGAPPVRGRNSRGRSSPELPAPKGLGRRDGGPSVRGAKRVGRSLLGRSPDVGRAAAPGRNSPRGRNGRSPEAGPRPSAGRSERSGRSVRGRKGLDAAKGRSVRSGRSVLGLLNGRLPPDGRPAAGRKGFPPGAGRLNPPLRGRSSRGLSTTGSMRKPGVLVGT